MQNIGKLELVVVVGVVRRRETKKTFIMRRHGWRRVEKNGHVSERVFLDNYEQIPVRYRLRRTKASL